MDYLTSIRPIKHQYRTGEEPVLVDCSDQITRVCKYSRSSGSAFKMACEQIGSMLAEAWNLGSPKTCFVMVQKSHVPNNLSPHYFSRPCIGTEFLQGVVDVTPASYSLIPVTRDNFSMLLKIALFDFWIANEDRNANNANLMYSIQEDRIVPIDYGCAFNTASFDYSLSQLTSTDTILNADIFVHLKSAFQKKDVSSLLVKLKMEYFNCINKSRESSDQIIDSFPLEWNLPLDIIRRKIFELQDNQWINDVWNNFVECLNENFENV